MIQQLDYTLPNLYTLDVDALKHAQDGSIETFRALAAPLLPADPMVGAVILQGCAIDFTTRAVTAGFIYLNGIIRRVEAHTAPAVLTEANAHWSPVDAFSASLDPYINGDGLGGTKSYHRILRAVLENASGAGRVAHTATLRHPSLEAANPWIQVGAGGAPAYAAGWSAGTPALSFKRGAHKQVMLRGATSVPSFPNSNWITCFTLPLGFRPQVEHQFVYHKEVTGDPGAVDHYLYRVLTSGEVQVALITSAPVSPGYAIHLDTIRFEAV
jgi:hypothetical protein